MQINLVIFKNLLTDFVRTLNVSSSVNCLHKIVMLNFFSLDLIFWMFPSPIISFIEYIMNIGNCRLHKMVLFFVSVALVAQMMWSSIRKQKNKTG